MFSKLLVLMTVAVVAVNAQGTPTIPPCILACVTAVSAVVGCSFADVACACENKQFQDDSALCFQTYCTPADIQAALALQAEQCTSGGTTLTPTGPNPTTTDSVTITLSSSGSGTGAATTTSSGSVSTSASASTPSASASAASTPSASAPSASNGGTTAPGTATSPTSTSSAATTTTSSAATSLDSNVVAAILAVFAGFLVI